MIFGGASLPATIDTNTLGSAGFTIYGSELGDMSGLSVSCAGPDVNGGGFTDRLIGARQGDGAANG